MKLSKEELLKKVNEYEIPDEVKIELMEDVTDSMEIAEPEENTELEEIKAKYEELKEKYKARFLEGEEKEQEPKEEVEELKEEEVIDVKEI